jgi:pyridoxine 5-phosphate synthase
MAATTEMIRIAQTFKPHRVTLVPERKDELTTEGGLDVVLHSGNLEKAVKQLLDARIDVSIFVDPDIEQLRQCHKIRAPKVELNTGKFADSWKTSNWPAELDKVATAARAARKMGLTVFAGHGLNYRNIDGIASIADIEELNIGHSIIARASLVGLRQAIEEMIRLIRLPRQMPVR